MKIGPRTNWQVDEIRYHHCFGVDHRLAYPVAYALVDFNTKHRAEGLRAVFVEGLRSEDRQRELVKAGASQTMRSLHVEGRALDFAIIRAGKVVSEIDPYYREVFALASDYGRRYNGSHLLEWGGHWRTLKDGAHIQLA